MRQFYTVVLDRMKETDSAFASEPYECGWASEAQFWVKVQKITPGQKLAGRVQMSTDGIGWADEGTTFPPMEKEGDYFVRVREFGGWLRLVLEPDRKDPFEVTTSLVLKE